MPQRRSGLSEPYFAMASAYGMRRNGAGNVLPMQAKMRWMTGSISP